MKKLFIALVVLVVLAFGIGLALPQHYTLARTKVINAKPSAIHKYVGDLAQWDRWTPWKEMDDTVKVELGKKTSGVGASQTWTSKDGAGSLEFTASDSDKGVEYDMTFAKWTSKGSIRYEKVGDSTKVTWSMEGDVGMPLIGGYFALLMPGMIGPQFERGLSKLKTVVEG